MDPSRLVLVRIGGRAEGSGYLIGRRLVLTGLHVVCDSVGRLRTGVQVRVGHPTLSPGLHERAAQVCWPDPDHYVPGGSGPDVALLWLEEPVVPVGCGPVRWGRPSGTAPVPYEGAGFPLFAENGGTPQVEHLRGDLPLVSTSGLGGTGRGWVLDTPLWPEGPRGRGSGSPWAGASGSAVFCRGLLVGVVVEADPALGQRRLHAEPVHPLFEEAAFTRLLERHSDHQPPLALEDVQVGHGPTSAVGPEAFSPRPLEVSGESAVGAGGDIAHAALGAQSRVEHTEMQADSTGSGTVHQAGRDITIHHHGAPTTRHGEGPAPLAPPPAVPAGFTGRDQDLENLLALLHPTADPVDSAAAASRPSDEAVVVASVLGMGGMGKTTLALAAGHAALKRGLFTGVLFLDLHGYDDNTLDTGQALDAALRGLGTDPEQIPPEADQRATLYRARLAARTRQGERILVLADNACAADQVQHLAPASGPHRLLVTSRDDFTAVLGARLVDLDVLNPEQAVALMGTALRLVLPNDGRTGADPDGTARVAELCGYLPLALQIAAAQLAADRSLKPARLAQELENLGDRLDMLEDGPRAVRSVLERSYKRLAPTHAELFRLLAVNPGPDLSVETAAAFTGVAKLKDVRARLVALSKASLVRQDPDTGRWRMHDLVRAYATEQAELNPQHSAKALTRLLDHYTRTTQAADAHLDPNTDGDKSRFPDRHAAMAWLDAERANLVAAVHTAHAAGHGEVTVNLTHFLGDHLRSRRYLQDALAVATLAHNAATSLGDRRREGVTWTSLGLAHRELRHFDKALDAHQHALDIYQDLGNRHGEAVAWNNLGGTLQELRRFDDALDAHQHALDIYRDLGDRHGEGSAWNNLGTALKELRRFDDALDAHQHDLDISRDLADRHSKGVAWNNLGLALQGLRRFDDALDAHQRAIGIYRELGDRHREGTAWNNLGTAWRSTEAYEQAVEAGERAVAVFRELDDAYREGQALSELADTLRAAGRPPGEVRAMREASAAAYRRAGADTEAEEALGKADE
ncbi:tetratricopeptide repeat protein [Streptomyces sp. NRRL B-24484]|uniref:tetratricopeptide repeat protein n=1 Tax=Streptomyces sp. NRRL B-24484 TaxID=1463833 RepID=UPI0006937E48|nr:tetratricopeptide repeat protein [Streptomyces sp. NRRL B-24484]